MTMIKLINGLQEKYDEFNWWIPENKKFYEKEAYKEIIKGHDLWDTRLALIAACSSCDDVLFHTDDRTKPYVIVHLTYNRNKDIEYPRYRAFSSCEEVINCIEDEFTFEFL